MPPQPATTIPTPSTWLSCPRRVKPLGSFLPYLGCAEAAESQTEAAQIRSSDHVSYRSLLSWRQRGTSPLSLPSSTSGDSLEADLANRICCSSGPDL